ncbi:MAG: GMC family oxidoreductase [Chloroflexota bacterium]|nr:GMC family oxidoreductase [Chloroflexota bacterium]
MDAERGGVADVLVIGGGFGGGVVALALAREGLSVVCLEQGDRPDPADYPGRFPEWELHARARWSTDPNVRRLPSDYPIEVSDSDVSPTLFNGVGGSSILYAAQWPRFFPSDFRVRTLDGVADDWPLSWRELWPLYDAADRQFGVSGVSGDPAQPPTEDFPLPPLPLGRAGEVVSRGMDALGWHWWPGTNAIASRAYEGRRPCVQRGTCGSGCGEGAKASTDRTHWPEAERLGARLVTGARVREISTSRDGLATGAVYIDRSGIERFQAARVVVLAASGIGNPRLLLLSTSPSHPNGLANSSGLVGRRLMLHCRASVIGLFDEPLRSWQGHRGESIHSYQFYESDASRGFVRGAKWTLIPLAGPLEAALLRRPGGQPLGEDLHRAVDGTLGHAAVWAIVGEDLPEESNEVVLDDRLRDGDGIPAPKLRYRISEHSRRLVAFHSARAAESLRAAGARDVIVDLGTSAKSPHLMGTTVMGTDPARSVVDAHGRAHDVPNLYVVGGSVFVTSAGVNPSPTIAALALRTAARIVAGRRDQVTAA